MLSALLLCASTYAPPAEFTKLKKEVDQKIVQFANKKGVAEKADATLSQMIGAKSPFITSWIKKHTPENASDEDVVRIWREYFARNFILTAYPQSEKTLNTEVEKLVDSITAEFAKKPFQDRMQKYFEKSQKASIETVKSFPIDEKDKTKIVTKIKAIKLYWPTDFKKARNNKIPLDIIDWGIAYDPVPNEINMGINAMSYSNEETYLAVFAHEIGHAFDSCRWGAQWPFQKVGACLRSEKSVGAKTRDDSLLNKMVKEKNLNTELVQSLKENPTCNKLVYPPVGTQADQLPESFADWFSAEVMAKLDIKDITVLRADLCEKRELSPGSSYVSNEARLARLYFAQPVLRAKAQSSSLKDPSLEKNSYCGLQ